MSIPTLPHVRRFFAIAIPVTIAVFLAAVFIPNLMTAMNRSKQKRTMADIRTIATAIEAYETDHPDWKGATIEGPAARLVSLLQPIYVKQIPLLDGWRRPFIVSVHPGVGYKIWSNGRDGTRVPKEGAFTDFDGDMVYENGTFTSFPEGT